MTTNEHALHDRIWLQVYGADAAELSHPGELLEPCDEITWCQHKINDTDVEYVRAEATKELREALCTLINSAEYQRGTVHEISTYDIEKADAVLEKYPAGGSDV